MFLEIDKANESMISIHIQEKDLKGTIFFNKTKKDVEIISQQLDNYIHEFRRIARENEWYNFKNAKEFIIKLKEKQSEDLNSFFKKYNKFGIIEDIRWRFKDVFKNHGFEFGKDLGFDANILVLNDNMPELYELSPYSFCDNDDWLDNMYEKFLWLNLLAFNYINEIPIEFAECTKEEYQRQGVTKTFKIFTIEDIPDIYIEMIKTIECFSYNEYEKNKLIEESIKNIDPYERFKREVEQERIIREEKNKKIEESLYEESKQKQKKKQKEEDIKKYKKDKFSEMGTFEHRSCRGGEGYVSGHNLGGHSNPYSVPRMG